MECEFAIICSKKAVPRSSSVINVLDNPIIEVKKSTIHKSPALVSIEILSELYAIAIIEIVVKINKSIVLNEYRVLNSESNSLYTIAIISAINF